MLERFAPTYPGDDRRAIASQWSKWLFHAWLSPTIALLVFDGHLPTGQPDDWGICFDSGGRAERLWLRSTLAQQSRQPLDAALREMESGVLAAVVSTLARHSGASVNVFWSNAGNLVEHVLSRLADYPVARPDRVEQALAFLDMPRHEDGVRNRLYRPVVYRVVEGETEPRRLRRACCIRYRLEECNYCENCPLACRSAKPTREGG
ncbi:MAG: siderophore-iron reductase FhuF [Thioalkalivibrio sp.]|nr:siderophore-iron reductase FhuF [Thioalkalivibrio sp.]